METYFELEGYRIREKDHWDISLCTWTFETEEKMINFLNFWKGTEDEVVVYKIRKIAELEYEQQAIIDLLNIKQIRAEIASLNDFVDRLEMTEVFRDVEEE